MASTLSTTTFSTSTGPWLLHGSSAPALAYDTYGRAGPAVLMLHGIPGSRMTFAEVGARLGETCQVVVPDLLGFGASPDAPRGAHAKEHAGAVVALLARLGIENVHLVGFDFGGPIAVHVADALGPRIMSITIAASNLFPDTPIPAPLRLAKAPWLGWLLFRAAFGKLGLLALYFAAVGDRGAFPFKRYRISLQGHCARTTRRIMLASMRDLPGLYKEVASSAGRVRCQSLVLWGDRDPFFPVDVGHRTALVLGAELRVLPGCGHFVPQERAAATAESIVELIERCAR